jgi:endonuclease IV
MSKIGVHVAKISKVLENHNRKTYLDAIKDDVENLNIGCVQIFVAGPANTRMANMDYKSIYKYCKENDINLYVHSSYLTVGIWSLTPQNKNTPKSESAIKHLENQLNACDLLKSRGFVVHLPKKRPEVIIGALEVIIPILDKYNTQFMLEMPASKPDDKTYETPEKINILTSMLIQSYPKFINWSWVIDTAHLWSCGVEVDNMKKMTKWFNELKYPDSIGLFHLNGSSVDQFNTGKDNHKVVFGIDDDIWNKDSNITDGFDTKKINKSTINLIAKFTKSRNLDLVCEINRGAYNEIKFSIDSLNKIFN